MNKTRLRKKKKTVDMMSLRERWRLGEAYRSVIGMKRTFCEIKNPEDS